MIRVCFEHNGIIVHEVRSADLDEPIIIGRGGGSDWPAPNEDMIISGKHARLYTKRRALWIEDLDSTNGTFFKGKRIKKQKLRSGDKITLGECMLTVEEVTAEVTSGSREPDLTFLSGKSKGETVTLASPVVPIGSDPDSKVVILDMLVSRHHAEIAVKDDRSCWIKDLGSRNGTSVNDSPLRADQERLLRNGDKISVAHVDLSFYDGTSTPIDRRVWLRIALMLATLLIAGGGYWAYQNMLKPPSFRFVTAARAHASAENFDAARDALARAESARGANFNQTKIQELKRLLGLWESALLNWNAARRHLQGENWTEASRCLGALAANRKEAWTWSANAVQIQDEAMAAKHNLDLYLRAEMSLQREDVAFEDFKKLYGEIRQTAEQPLDAEHAFLEPLQGRMHESIASFADAMTIYQKMDSALEKMGQSLAHLPEAAQALERTARTTEGSVRRRAERLLDPVSSLAENYEALDKARQRVVGMGFSGPNPTAFALPPPALCSLDKRVSLARSQLETSIGNLKRQTGEIGYLLGEVGDIGRAVDVVAQWQDEAAIEKVFACDCLGLPFPKRNREEPDSEFDRYLGIRDFFEFLRSLPERSDLPWRPEGAFRPVLGESAELIRNVARIERFLEKPEHEWMNSGRLGETLLKLRQSVQDCDEVKRRMFETAQNSEGRRAVIAAGIAAQLAREDDNFTFGEQQLDEWIADRLKESRDVIRKLKTTYDATSPTEQIEIRDEILRTGIPGDPIVRKMWVSKSASLSMGNPR